jgi:threonyl-tRNA synthetase
MSQEVKHKNIVILPFAHLSNNLANSEDGIKAIDFIEEKLKQDYHVIRAHFGSHKSLLLDIYGHPGNARYREFY